MTESRTLIIEPIGIARTPFIEKADAPRQPAAARGIEGTIELLPGRGFEDALSDIEQWTHLWLVFWFHLNQGWRPKVTPPRSDRKRGVFATRSPHRPNPIGISAVELVRVDGLTLHVVDIDLVDGTPIIDIKPYVAYADSIDARGGWIEGDANKDPGAVYSVVFDTLAQTQLAFLNERGISLQGRLEQALSLGPQPHAYRRIKRDDKGDYIAIKDWRARFIVNETTITVESIHTGVRPRELAASNNADAIPHRAFVETFGW
jgi:tRNA-Thr(GGU) m(6)t(6)A37 methyltransferase TsaA